MSAAADERLLGRAARIATVLGKYGFGEARRDSDPPEARARRLRQALEELGPTFAKLGQILSTRPDLIPPEAVAELAALQDRVTPLAEAEVVVVMEQELGVPWEDVFARIEPEPLAAGTIGQVHRALLEDGERVVVKVQRPTAEQDIMRDLSLLELFAEKTANREALRRIVDLPAAIEHLSDSLRRELDFRREGENVERLRAALGSFPRLGAPRVYEGLSTSRLLVLEEIPGVPVREMPPGREREEAARELLEFYYRQILVEGFFHADPHPGNMLWWEGRIYFLDFGMVGELSPEMRGHLLLLLLAFWQEDVRFLTEVVLIMAGPEAEHADAAGLQADLTELLHRYRHTSLGEIQLGPLLQEIAQSATNHGVRLPASLVLTGKALAQMQLSATELDPELDPFSVVGRFLFRNLATRAREGLEPKRLFYDAQKLKVRAERLVEAVEGISGARPGERLQIDVRGLLPLDQTIRVTGRRLAIAVVAAAALVAMGNTAAASRVHNWVPISLGALGAVLVVALLADLLRRR
ncbi:MAG TPA: AarF/UbiB family protein [Gaiellaceae bacterium]|nr:AarF/UbiB family protein [Gaiellaceae bacterium]